MSRIAVNGSRQYHIVDSTMNMDHLKVELYAFRTTEAVFGANPKMMFISFFPKLAKMFPNWSGYNYLLSAVEPVKNFFNNTIKEHERTLQDEHPRDYIDAVLLEVKNTDDPNSSFHKSKSGFYLNHVLILVLMCVGEVI